MSWDEIVAQAQEEGEVAWFVWYFQPQYRELAAAFTEEYGIDVVIPEGTHDGNIEKFLAEAGRDAGDIDVLAMGTDRIDLFDPTEMAIGPLLDVLPDVAASQTEVGGYDGMGYAFGYWGNQTGIAYDPRRWPSRTRPRRSRISRPSSPPIPAASASTMKTAARARRSSRTWRAT
jgi:putative spermidine/putrescine transport system substrate-binding protein